MHAAINLSNYKVTWQSFRIEINLFNPLGLLQVDNADRTIIFPCSSAYGHIIVVYFSEYSCSTGLIESNDLLA